MFESIARLVDRRGWLIVVGWLAFTGILYVEAPSWESVARDDDVRFFPPGFPSVRGQELLEKGFPQDAASSQAVVIAERRDGRLRETDLAYVDLMMRKLDELRTSKPNLGIKQIIGYRTPVIGPRLLGTGRDGNSQAVLTEVSLRGTYQAKETRVVVDELHAALKALPRAPDGLKLALTGSASVGHDMNDASIKSINATTITTIVLVVIILLVVYQSPLLALIPLLTIALSAVASLLAIPLLTKIPGLHFRVINITNVFVIVVLFGAGTDYCLFLIARYREELVRGRPSHEAVSEAIKAVGGALVASAGTVICGLGMLWFSSFSKIQYTGPAIALSLAIGLLASLTLAPVLLHWLRGAVFWPFRPPHHVKGADMEAESLADIPMSGFWMWVSSQILKRPGLILLVSLLALAPLAVIGARTKPSYSQLADLSKDQPSVIGANMVQRYFALGELSPSAILVYNPELDFLSPKGREAVERVSRELATLSDVAEVRAVSRPLGKPRTLPQDTPSAQPRPQSAANLLERFQKKGIQAMAEQAERVVRTIEDAHYVSTKAKPPYQRHITRIELVFKTDPFAPESLEILETVRKKVAEAARSSGPLAGTQEIGLAGSSAMVSDLKKVTSSDEHQMYWLVTAGVYLILVLLLRRPGICLYLILTVVIGYLASLGITDIVFRALHHGPEPFPGLDWKVGFFLFVILVAVGEDYNIFLMSRVIEEERKHGAIEGTRRAVAHTGGIISSCGLIMAGTFGSMLAASLTALRELGFALGLGVLLDTFVVRPILVPAFVVLIHRAHHVLPRRYGRSSNNGQPTSRDETETAATSAS